MAKRKSPNKATKDVSASGSEQSDAIDAATEETSETHADTPAQEAATQDVSIDGAAQADDSTEAATEVEVDAAEAPEISDESPEPENTYVPEPVPIQPDQQRTSVLPLIFAGILTAVLGFMAARSDFLPESLRIPTPQIDPAIADGLANATDRLAALEASVATAAKNADLDPIASQVSSLSESTETLMSQVDALVAQVETLAARPQVEGLASRPQGDVVDPEEALNAALAELRETANQQQAEIDKLLADARLIRSDTQAEATATLQRAALTRIMAAVDTGAPFGAALGDLEQAGETDVPDALRSAADGGVTPLATLQETYPDAARNALAAARSSGEESGGLGGFLQRQLATRSIEPREGSDPDAVLSRMEAAVRAGRIGDALAEADQLPDPARDAMVTWLEQAQTRYDAVSAANALADRLSAL